MSAAPDFPALDHFPELDEAFRTRFWSRPPIAFFSALVLAPLAMALIGVLTLPLLGLGVVVLASVPMGAPSYLLFGAPLFWITILRGGRGVFRFVAAGALADVLAGATMILALRPFGVPLQEAVSSSMFIHGFGALFAPLYGLLFGLIFERLVDPDALPPPPPPDLETLLGEKEIRHA